jgi:hypothetical protein
MVEGAEGVDAAAVKEGVRMACNVNAAAVCMSLGGGNCSNGILQARMARIILTPASTNLRFRVIKSARFFSLQNGGHFAFILSFSAA